VLQGSFSLVQSQTTANFVKVTCKIVRHLVVVLNAGADADVDKILAGHTDGGPRLDYASLHSHSHYNGVPGITVI
jgi:hypothetical protein